MNTEEITHATSKYGNNGGGRRAYKFDGPISALANRIFAEIIPETMETLANFRPKERNHDARYQAID
ncbi:MAG TPA: hypothetical protein VKK81_27770 [Candidatus Binatia bacterium]|nr:hypothetical protein [Candidatus Binatia bacterium]